MPKIVETNLFHIVLFEKQIEVLGDKVGLDKSAHGIYIDVVQIILAVAISAYLLVDCLLCLEIAKQRFKRRYQRKGSATGFCLGGIFLHHLGFAVDGELNHAVPDTDGFAFKINGIPFQTDNLTTAQTVERSKNNCQFQRITLTPTIDIEPKRNRCNFPSQGWRLQRFYALDWNKWVYGLVCKNEIK